MINLDHIDPGNAGGSVQIPVSSIAIEEKRKFYECHVCNKKFENLDERDEHVKNEHPIKEPILLIDDKRAYSEKIVFRDKRDIEDIRFLNCQHFYLDNKEADPNYIIQELTSCNEGYFSLSIKNFHKSINYSIEIAIADESELKEVDEYFLNLCEEEDIYQIFRKTNEMASTYGRLSKPYIAGLAMYVQSIGIKSNHPQFSRRSVNDFEVKMNESLDKLRSFKSRVVAKVIISISSFMKNEFEILSADEFFPGMKNTKQYFLGESFIHNNLPEFKSDFKSFIVDKHTAGILQIISDIKNINIDQVKDYYNKSSGLSYFDDIKITYILWLENYNTGRYSDASNYTRKLKNENYLIDTISKREQEI